MKQHKRIPYGQTNFEKIRTENYLYVDKTRFIEQLENEGTDFNFLLRPRKFGKTLFLSMLEYYYDIRFKNKFDELFGGLYIGKNPTPNRNNYFVLFFEFSGLDTSNINNFNSSLNGAIRGSILNFLQDHNSIFENHKELEDKLWEMDNVRDYIEFAFKIIKSYNKKAYIIIDEYDHFANDMMATGTYLGETNYKKAVWAGSQIRDFYETLKANSRTVIDKIFITGITPIMLDDLTSGFNISNNLSTKEKYNEILGFTKEEVEIIIQKCEIDKSLISIDLEKMYDGYLFNAKAKNKLYNSAMIFNYLHGISDEGLDF